MTGGAAYLITAAFVLTRSEVDVTKVFTASVLTTAVIQHRREARLKA